MNRGDYRSVTVACCPAFHQKVKAAAKQHDLAVSPFLTRLVEYCLKAGPVGEEAKRLASEVSLKKGLCKGGSDVVSCVILEAHHLKITEISKDLFETTNVSSVLKVWFLYYLSLEEKPAHFSKGELVKELNQVLEALGPVEIQFILNAAKAINASNVSQGCEGGSHI